MELKGCNSYTKRALCQCFNRTFMELKERQRLAAQFYSNSFNRTFMELKGVILSFAVTPRKFQSHLYGIERYHRIGYIRGNVVSIAPLWN